MATGNWFDKTVGTYRGQCSQICGKEHGYMPIVVVAKSPEDYAADVAHTNTAMSAAIPSAMLPSSSARESLSSPR